MAKVTFQDERKAYVESYNDAILAYFRQKNPSKIYEKLCRFNSDRDRFEEYIAQRIIIVPKIISLSNPVGCARNVRLPDQHNNISYTGTVIEADMPQKDLEALVKSVQGGR